MRVMIDEYRAYYVLPGKMSALYERFSKVTMSLFKRHGMQVVGFWETIIGESNELSSTSWPSRIWPTESGPDRHSMRIRNGRRPDGPARQAGRSLSGS